MHQILIGTILEGPDEPIVIEKFEGRGGFGEVFKARGQNSAKYFAVKTLQAGEMSNLGALQALMNEIRMAQQIDHPNVVKLLSASDG